MDLKEFKQIPKHPEYYINKNADVYSTKVNRLLTSKKNTRGYWFVAFTCDYVMFQYTLHRLLAHTFLGMELDSELQVHHKDGDINNNTLDNLEVLTRSDHIDITLEERGFRNKRLNPRVCDKCGCVVSFRNKSGLCNKCRVSYGNDRATSKLHLVVPYHSTVEDFEILFATFGENWLKLGSMCGISDNGLRKIYRKINKI